MTRSKERRSVGTLEERFIKAIERLQVEPGGIVANTSLKSELKWNEDRYNGTKSHLKETGKVIVLPGNGGPMRLPVGTETEAPIKIFLSYCHADIELKRSLLAHMKPLTRKGVISVWQDSEIKAGDHWEKQIWQNLEEADIILFLISIDFINSQFCYDKEFTKALELNAQNKVKIIPIIARECLWNILPFGEIQALPEGAKAIASSGNIDEAMTSVVRNLEIVAKDLKSKNR